MYVNRGNQKILINQQPAVRKVRQQKKSCWKSTCGICICSLVFILALYMITSKRSLFKLK